MLRKRQCVFIGEIAISPFSLAHQSVAFMILIWKNKGLLVILFFIVSMIGTAILFGTLERNVGGIFKEMPTSVGIATGLFISAIWTFATKDDFYRDKEGNRKKMDTVNELFFISMKWWAIIFLLLGIFALTDLIFHYRQ